MKLLIIGAGGYGKLVKEIAEMTGYETIDFLDDDNLSAVGKIDDLEAIESQYDGSIVAIGNPDIREKIFKHLKFPVSLVHPSAVISKNATIGRGCVIEALAVVNSFAVVKDGTFICAGAVVNHDSKVGEFCQIDCNSVVAMGSEVPCKMKINSCTVFIKKPEMAREFDSENFFLI